MAAKPKTIDEYLAAVSDDKRPALEKLRKAIQAAAPQAEEYIGYGLAAYRLNGRFFVAFGAAKNHCAFYPGAYPLEAHSDELKDYDTSKGTIRFPADKPLPVALVRKLVKTRIAENEKRSAKVKKPKAAASKRVVKPARGKARADPAVVAFLDELDHPHKGAIEAVRQIILGVSPTIREGIKWNAPSFRTTEYFATLNLRQGRVWLILHTGAKGKADAAKPMEIADPTRLLKWLAKDRCLVTFDDETDVEAKRPALQAIVRAWIRQL